MANFIDNGSWVRVKLEKNFIELLHDSKIFSTVRSSQPSRWIEGGFLFFKKSIEIEPWSAVYSGDLLYSMGSFSFVTNPFDIHAHGLQISFGRYCSIGGGARIVGPAHPMNGISTATLFFDPTISLMDDYIESESMQGNPLLKRPQSKGAPIIGHDVWFGGNVTLNTGISIGNGAVVAANAHVTSNVPDYAIVGGNPARIIRFRFPEEIVKELKEIKPWEYSPKDLAKFDISNMERFILEFKSEKDSLKKFTPKPIKLWESYKIINGISP